MQGRLAIYYSITVSSSLQGLYHPSRFAIDLQGPPCRFATKGTGKALMVIGKMVGFNPWDGIYRTLHNQTHNIHHVICGYLLGISPPFQGGFFGRFNS